MFICILHMSSIKGNINHDGFAKTATGKHKFPWQYFFGGFFRSEIRISY